MFGLLLTLFAVALAAYLAQRQFVYFPARQDLAQAQAEAARAGLEPWRHEGRFLGWRAPFPGRAEGSVLVLHGNAGAASRRTYFPPLFQNPALGARFDVYLLEYPGYGPRPGSPSEASLAQAAAEAVALLQGGPGRPLWLVGESLGSAAAALAARPGAVQALLLITPFPSLPAVGRYHYPFLPGAFFRDRFDAARALSAFPGPVAFLLAGRDDIVPPALGRALFDGHPGLKQLWVQPEAGHNSLDYRPGHPCWREILAFLARPGP